MDRILPRGDTIFFAAQIFHNPDPAAAGGQIVSAPINQPPVGFAPTNISTYLRILFTLKNNFADADSKAVVQLDNLLLGGVAVTDATSGKYTVTGPPIVTANFPDTPVKLLYDVQIKDASGRIFTVESGTITIEPDVTRAIA